MTPNNTWAAFTTIPHITEHYNNWNGPGDMAVCPLPKESYPTWKGDWRESLIILEDSNA